ncbi:UDP-N-acetyl-D-glucosamine dehydrogenase [Endozoicomonas sp. (ex Bugula neritina AB1)]|nr:UDP-N-acetyl-D-glucosamine dehydrogenase [Endozoicomonas sp. (ex Bugula neritina AB1)]
MLRTAVIGTGYLGRFHAQKYAQLAGNQLIGVADINEDSGRTVAAECNTRYFKDYRQLIGLVDAVSVVVPTSLHSQVAGDFLKAGVHVLVEKPITSNLSQAETLVELARARGLVLQVGFLERFNAALGEIRSLIKKPKFIESHRLAGFKPRSMDINVVMDLMIHDLDIILNLVNSPLEHIAANGAKVISDSVDIAQARLTFEDGCVANITASRISQKSKRKMRVFQDCSCISVDFETLTMNHFHKGGGEQYPSIPNIECTEKQYEDSDALRREIEDFLSCVRLSEEPKVTGEDGRRVLEVACRISEIISESKV